MTVLGDSMTDPEKHPARHRCGRRRPEDHLALDLVGGVARLKDLAVAVVALRKGQKGSG